MGHKAVETTHSINSAFGPETANRPTVQWWFRKVYKGDEALKVRSTVASQWKLAGTN